MKKIFLILTVAFVIGLSACENEVDPGRTPVQELSNEWWVELLIEDGSGGYEDIYHLGHFQFLTSGTAANTADSIFVDDFGAVAELKAKVACDMSSLTFGNTGTVAERYTDGTVLIENGKVLPLQGVTQSGVEVDSIYFEVEFDWDPGQKYIIAGHARTGFNEDEF